MFGTVQESAPTTKLSKGGAGNFSERLDANKDHMSYNHGHITIDDDGNMDLEASSEGRSDVTQEEIIDEVKTFVASHLLFSHLMHIDSKKNTLSELNEANHA